MWIIKLICKEKSMKKGYLSIILLVVIFSSSVFGQEADSIPPKKWSAGGIVNINLNQTSLSNWAAGGVNSISATGLLDLHLNYKNSKNTAWDNTFKSGYGIMNQDGRKSQKTDDFFEFNSAFTRNAFNSKNWYYAASINLKSQYTAGYKDPEKQLLKISEFMAPGYANTSIGLTYKNGTTFTWLLAPISYKTTFVLDQQLADSGAYGVKKAEIAADGKVITPGQNIRHEIGFYSRMNVQKEILTNVTLKSKLELFSNYLHNPQNIDVNWEMLFDMKINKFMSATLNFYLIYDDDIKIPVETAADGTVTKSGPRVQFKEVLGLGLNFKF